MEFLRVYWPALIGLSVVLLAATLLLPGPGRPPFRERNRDGAFLLALTGVLVLIVAGSQAALHRTAREFATFREGSVRDAESVRAESREWSLRYSFAEAERDSLRRTLETAEEGRSTIRLRGRVVDRATGEAVPGARVRVVRHDPSKHAKDRVLADSLRCGADGAFELEAPSLGPRGVYRVDASAEGFAAADAWVGAADAAEPVVIRLRS